MVNYSKELYTSTSTSFNTDLAVCPADKMLQIFGITNSSFLRPVTKGHEALYSSGFGQCVDQ